MNIAHATKEQMEVLRDLGLLEDQDVLVLSPEVQESFSADGISTPEVRDVASNYGYLTRGVVQIVKDESDLFASTVRDECLDTDPLTTNVD